MSTIITSKNDGESNEGIIRRFVRKVQVSGKLSIAKGKQYRQPTKSKSLRRRSAVKRQELRTEKELLRKTGKLEQMPTRRKR